MSDDIFDKVINYIDNMSDDDLFNLIKECKEYPEFCFAIEPVRRDYNGREKID